MYDIVIIGSGPAGLTAAIYAARAQLSAVVVEKEYMGTGQIAESERVDNYPGLFGENGFDLGEKFRSHAESLGAEFYEGEAVGITPDANGYTVRFADSNTLQTKTIIYAAGASHRRLGIPGEDAFSGKGVSWCAVCDGAFYKNKTVAVVGGGDTALGDALFLSKIAKKVYLIHRRQTFRANLSLQEKVRNTANIELVLDAVTEEITGEKNVSGILISQNGTQQHIEADGVFVAVGSVPNTSILEGLVRLDAGGYIIAQENGVTSAEGIFAAGDVRTKHLRQVVTAVSDGANCVLSAESYLSQK